MLFSSSPSLPLSQFSTPLKPPQKHQNPNSVLFLNSLSLHSLLNILFTYMSAFSQLYHYFSTQSFILSSSHDKKTTSISQTIQTKKSPNNKIRISHSNVCVFTTRCNSPHSYSNFLFFFSSKTKQVLFVFPHLLTFFHSFSGFFSEVFYFFSPSLIFNLTPICVYLQLCAEDSR